MVRVKFQDGTYLGIVKGMPTKVTTKEQAYIYSTVESAKSILKRVFYSRVLKGYNRAVYVDMNDKVYPEWQ